MCETYAAACEVCGEIIPMHLPDPGLSAADVAVRCDNHPPLPVDHRPFVLFTNCADGDFPTVFNYGNIYVAYVGAPENLGYLNSEDEARAAADPLARRHYWGVGEDGGIHPNCDWRHAVPLSRCTKEMDSDGHEKQIPVALRYSLEFVLGTGAPDDFLLLSRAGTQHLGHLVDRRIVRPKGTAANVEVGPDPQSPQPHPEA